MKNLYWIIGFACIAVAVIYFMTRKKCTCQDAGNDTQASTEPEKLPTLTPGFVDYTGNGAFVPSYKPQTA